MSEAILNRIRLYWRPSWSIGGALGAILGEEGPPDTSVPLPCRPLGGSRGSGDTFLQARVGAPWLRRGEDSSRGGKNKTRGSSSSK
eukprot:489068-Pyramimonas_sp.AAC.1